MTYTASVIHHSLAQHRSITIRGTLRAAKAAATREFGAGFVDHRIVILDKLGDIVASRRIGDARWQEAA